MTDTPVIRTRGLSKRYRGTDALVDLDLEVAPGEVVGYLGPNGAGKTTTIRLLLGLIRPTSGTSQLFGLDSLQAAVAVHRRLAYVSGEPALWPNLTGAEVLHLLGQVQGSVDLVYRDDLVDRFALDPSKKVRAYSKGNRQKVVLIAALASRPDLLILDEPTAGLDPLMAHEFRSCVLEAKGRGQTVFLSSHLLSEVEALCDQVGVLRDGRLIEMGTLAAMRHLSAVTVEVSFEGDAPDLSAVDGVLSATANGRHASLQVRGSMDPLLQVLAGSHVRQLRSRDPSLDELFLTLYGDVGATSPRAG